MPIFKKILVLESTIADQLPYIPKFYVPDYWKKKKRKSPNYRISWFDCKEKK